jgi:hypothetical protein
VPGERPLKQRQPLNLSEFSITADSKPVLDGWGWDSNYWSCDDWLSWHRLAAARYGVDKANQDFLTEWNKQTFGASTLDCRTINGSFREYIRSVGLLDALYDGAIIAKPLGAASDVISSGSNVVSSVASGAENTINTIAKVAPILIVVVIAIALFLIGIYIYKKSNLKSQTA